MIALFVFYFVLLNNAMIGANSSAEEAGRDAEFGLSLGEIRPARFGQG